MHAIGQLFIAAVLIIVCGAILRRMAMAAFGSGAPKAAGGGSRSALRQPGVPRAARTGTMRSVLTAAAHPGNGQVRAKAKADIATTWHKAMAANWLELQRHGRQNVTEAGTLTTPGTATAARPTIRQRLRLAPFTPAGQDTPADGGSSGNGTPANGNGPAGTNGTSAPAPLAPARQPGPAPPAQPAPAPQAAAPPSSTNGGTTVAPTTAGAEQLIEGINRIHAEAAAGGIRHKQAALKAMNEASLRFSAMAQMISRTMAEPGNNYGNEITEPLSQGAQHLQAAAMSFGESDNALTSLIHMTVGELADSPRQAPHHSELSEDGRPSGGFGGTAPPNTYATARQ